MSALFESKVSVCIYDKGTYNIVYNRYNLSAFEFDAFLIVYNLATLNSRSSTVVIKHDEWEDFIMEHGLSDIVQKIGHAKFDLPSSSMEV